MRIQKLLQEIAKEISPDKKTERKLKSLARKVLKTAKKKAKEYGAEAMLVGSIVRDTWLPDKKEFDIFILFPPTLSFNELEKYGLEVGISIVKELGGTFTLKYAQHPYISAKLEDVEIDIVPCFKVKDTSQMKSAVDRTPFHIRYLNRKMNKKLSTEVRLLKKFLKEHELYGADAKVEGFSGYLCELLIIKYGSFLNLLRKSQEWALQEIIDLEKHYKKEEYEDLRRIFRGQPLIVIDPTDKKRNVAAALSIENFYRFKKIAKEFLENPSRETFFSGEKKYLTDLEFSKLRFLRETEFLAIKFIPPKISPEILWPQLRKFGERIKNILEEKKYEFKVYGHCVYTDENELAIVFLELEIYKLPKIQKIVGPYVFDEKNSKRFIDAHKNCLSGPYIENGRWIVEVERKFKTAKEKIFDSLNEKVEILKAKGIPSYIAEALSKGFQILDSRDIEKLIRERRDIGEFLYKYFNKEKLV